MDKMKEIQELQKQIGELKVKQRELCCLLAKDIYANFETTFKDELRNIKIECGDVFLDSMMVKVIQNTRAEKQCYIVKSGVWTLSLWLKYQIAWNEGLKEKVEQWFNNAIKIYLRW